MWPLRRHQRDRAYMLTFLMYISLASTQKKEKSALSLSSCMHSVLSSIPLLYVDVGGMHKMFYLVCWKVPAISFQFGLDARSQTLSRFCKTSGGKNHTHVTSILIMSSWEQWFQGIRETHREEIQLLAKAGVSVVLGERGRKKEKCGQSHQLSPECCHL